MDVKYIEISNYWAKVRCRGGNPDFPFHLYASKKVLEIGCGDGVDATRFIWAGANYIGIDIIEPSVSPYFRKMNAEDIDFPDDYLDLVYSWGVIHHAVNPEKVISEIYRVLKPGAWFYVMLYNKPSFRYNIEIMVLRKILWHCGHMKYDDIMEKIPNPTKEEWISMNTDSIGCPLSRVYTKQEAEELFKNFKEVSSQTRRLGWFRIIVGRK